MRRRQFIAGLGGAIAASIFHAGSAAEKTYRIGYLFGNARGPIFDVTFGSLAQGLEELGYVQGKNIEFEVKFTEGHMERLPELAADLARLKVDIIVATSNLASLAAQKATQTIPIVAIAVHDGVGAGLFASLAHPGSNITGIDSNAPDIDPKRLEFLKQMLPSLTRITFLYNPDFPGGRIHLEAATMAAKALGAVVRPIEVRTLADFPGAFDAIHRDPPDAMLTVSDPLMNFMIKQIGTFALENRIPMVGEFSQYTEAGGLLSYGATFQSMWRRGAYFVDRILKGALPGDLPVELPTVYELAINVGSAKALGLKVPDSILATANKVFD
jgi:putative tryptophan/tyrosine transport system substrate-binding protein